MTEHEEVLQAQYETTLWHTSKHDEPKEQTSSQRKKDFYAKHLLLRIIAQNMGCIFTGIHKNSAGKPLAVHASYHLSIAHTKKYLMASIHLKKAVGVDIESTQRHFYPLREKFLSQEEIKSCGADHHALCLHWTAKEAAYKCIGKRGYTLKTLRVSHHPHDRWQVSVRDYPSISLSLQWLITDHHIATYSM